MGVFLFAGAAAAGYFWPEARPGEPRAIFSEAFYTPSPPAARPASPFGARGQAVETMPQPELEGPALTFLKQIGSYVYYDPPFLVPDMRFIGKQEEPLKLSDHRGRYVLLNVWASWCGYCIVELPGLQELKDRYADKGLDVVAVSVDADKGIESIGRFLENRGIGDVALNHDYANEVQRSLPVNVLPVSFLIDPEGRVLYSFGGSTNWMSSAALAFFDTYASVN